MYKSIYECDCCGKEMQSPMYTLELKTNSFCIQDRAAWHYCNDCWGYIKKGLTKKSELDDLVLEKAVAKFKEANKEWDKAAKWYKLLFALALDESAQQEKKDTTYSSPYMSYTVSTSGEKTIQAKSAGDRFSTTVGCCCENTNKDSLNYKQTTGI